jgi:hypothetical protein
VDDTMSPTPIPVAARRRPGPRSESFTSGQRSRVKGQR